MASTNHERCRTLLNGLKVGKTLDDGTWKKPDASQAITREIISVKSFNLSEIQMVDITLSNLSTLCVARFSTEIYTRGCHWIPRLLA
jgi:hypothetical protein